MPEYLRVTIRPADSAIFVSQVDAVSQNGGQQQSSVFLV
jgi:hypothetical protein